MTPCKSQESRDGEVKVLKFRDGADVFVVPEGEVESVGSFSPDGATLTLRSGQEVTVDRRAGVEPVEVASVEEMVKLVVNREKKPMCQLTKDTKCGRLPHQKGKQCGQNTKFKWETGSTGSSSKKTSASGPKGPGQ